MPSNLEFRVEFTPIAREDIRAITQWYRNELEGLEGRFLNNLEAAISLLQGNPKLYPVSFGSIRSALMRRFPYRIYYFLEADVIFVLGVIHTKRSPKLIRRRRRN
jgi:toxin ParE1/3/4